MRAKIWPSLGLALLLLTGTTAPAAEPKLQDAPPPPAGFPKFVWQEIDASLKIGYAVILEDLNGDKKPDIIVVDQHKIVWYENPTWKKRVILDGKTKPDNVCICALDIDGDGDLELVVGAGWKPFDTKNPGTLQWLKRGKTIDDTWDDYAIPCDEPTVHRIRAIDLDGDGRKEIVLAPLMGREATQAANWTDGRPVRILSYKVPATPHKPESWKPTVLSEELHVVHNFAPFTPPGAKKPMSLMTASYEGYSAIILGANGTKTQTSLTHEANQANPKSNRGSSEIKPGTLLKTSQGGGIDRSTGAVVATVEPWHGNEIVVYTGPSGKKPTRQVLDNHLRWGHAVSFGDLDGDGADELVIGVRDNPAKDDKFTEKRGVRLYRSADSTGEKWDRYILEDGGVAVEDLAVGDLNGDGRPDIVAVGRATGNCRIYWNQGR
ncbi:FG-GAP repeat domain-containing protein [Limnoglobus roseus]|uniref:VCBS repeat-containing protein n=1 Tax=Limnoglobus roseus TaxID=2598579 RepID=A0A5C1AIZ4_9BACT|nr:VCBS repeat-containing protein [Limnoglobus roseus]QEL17084.1 VCBS repeat-containing protein [Limnoglobus roseus]